MEVLRQRPCLNKCQGHFQTGEWKNLQDFLVTDKINLFRIRLFYSLASPIHTTIFAFENFHGADWLEKFFKLFILNHLQKKFVTEVAKLCKK
jgi:hypothetical protein